MWRACIAVVRVDHLWYYIATCTTAMSADIYKKFKMRCNRFSHDGEREREREKREEKETLKIIYYAWILPE